MIIVLDNLRSAYNVGSIIRTCDALGIKEIHSCGITPDSSSPKVRKTALGAEKSIRWLAVPSTYDHLIQLRDAGYQIIGLELDHTSRDIATIVPNDKSALVVGNEVSGLAAEILDLCDIIAQIPMQGIKESLNVSVAFGIAAYNLVNKRLKE